VKHVNAIMPKLHACEPVESGNKGKFRFFQIDHARRTVSIAGCEENQNQDLALVLVPAQVWPGLA
jgi:hypothetical protein